MSVNIFINMLYFNLKEVLHTTLFFIQCYIIFEKKSLSTIFFMNTVVHYLIFFMNCCPSEIIVLFLSFIYEVESDAQVEMQELFDICYNQYQSAVCPLE